jgi:bifunctional DNA-binding transcriptional regulator/antitoxin component of YhaV-PrlF toxin-antitoxin module
VIPAELRKKYHIEPGKEMHLMEYGGILYLIPPTKDPVKEAAGILPKTPSLSKKLLTSRKGDFE